MEIEPAPPVPADTVSVAHRVMGDGPPVLLVGGTGYPGATWPVAFVEHLARDHAMIMFDHRGTGDTPGTDHHYSTRLFAADALRLLDDLGRGPAHVLGHSMGGRVAQWMALDGPDRVSSLILAASGPGRFRADQTITRGIPIRAAVALVEKGYREYIASLIRSTFFTTEFLAAEPTRVDWLIGAFWEHRPTLEDYLKHVVARQQHQTAELLDRISQPALVLVGSRDTHVGGTGSHFDQSRYLAEALPNAELSVIDQAAHGYFWSHPDESARIVLEFLRRHSSS